jgi:hypothetical protein
MNKYQYANENNNQSFSNNNPFNNSNNERNNFNQKNLSKNDNEFLNVMNFLSNSGGGVSSMSSRLHNISMNKSSNQTDDMNSNPTKSIGGNKESNNYNSKSKLKEVMTPNLLNYILNLENKSHNTSNNNSSSNPEVMTKSELVDSSYKNFSESKDENYNDICNNICINSQNEDSKFKEESNDNERLKEQINKEIEDMYQLSLKNSQNLNSNKKRCNKNIHKEIIKPREKEKDYLFEENEFKQSNTEFI